LLSCPEPLAYIWWEPFLADGYGVEGITESGARYWTYYGSDNAEPSADLAKSKTITHAGKKIAVVVLRDFECVFDDREALWFTYHHDIGVDQWLSRVLIASGAQPVQHVLGCKRLFSCSDVSLLDRRADLESIGTIAEHAQAPEKYGVEISRKGVSISLYSGKYVNYRTRQLGWYAAIDYKWRPFRRAAVESLTNEVTQRMLSLGFALVKIARYHPVRNR
jgi:hypothetical protein